MNTLTCRVPAAAFAFALLFSLSPAGAGAAPASTSHRKASHHSSRLTKKAHKHTRTHKKAGH